MIDIDIMSNTTMPMWRPGDWRPGPVFSTATETLLLSLGVTTFYRKGPFIYHVILSCPAWAGQHIGNEDWKDHVIYECC